MNSADLLPFPRLLLGPGPSPVSPNVLAALGRPPLGYLDPELFSLLDDINDGLRALFGTENRFTLPLTGTGMAGMEFCLANLIEPGENVVIAVNGFFGARMCDIAARHGATVHRVDFAWGEPVGHDTLAEICARLKNVALIGMVHAETSTGVESPIAPIADVAGQHNALLVVDAVTSLGGLPVNTDENRVDACYSASQKCVGTPPGLAPVTLSARAWEKIERRKSSVADWYLDAKLLDAYYFQRPAMYHHTVPVNSYYALKTVLDEIREETLERRFARHQQASALLWQQIVTLPQDLSPLAATGHRLPMLSALRLPESLSANEAPLRARLLSEYGIEIGGGLGDLKGKAWRIGLMGHGAQPRNVYTLIGALRALLS